MCRSPSVNAYDATQSPPRQVAKLSGRCYASCCGLEYRLRRTFRLMGRIDRFNATLVGCCATSLYTLTSRRDAGHSDEQARCRIAVDRHRDLGATSLHTRTAVISAEDLETTVTYQFVPGHPIPLRFLYTLLIPLFRGVTPGTLLIPPHPKNDPLGPNGLSAP